MTDKNNKHKLNILTTAISLLLSQSINATEINVTENIDDGTGLIENTLSWSILQANNVVGDDTIILNTSLKLTGVMKRLINSNITLKSDEITRTIDGDERFRPLFIKSGNVLIENINISKGHARGGDGSSSGEGGGGAGMGGSLFIYSGNVTLANSTIQNSSTSTFSSRDARSGGGMYGTSRNSRGGGGLFASYETDDQEGAYGGYGNYDNVNTRFGKGGFLNNFNGGFGGGGRDPGGDGGFGGGGGYNTYGNGGDGGFGGGAGDTYSGNTGIAGFGANETDAASMGGAIFIRSGNLKFENVLIEYSQAIAKNGAKGLGGAIFIMHTTSHENGNNQGMPLVLPTVSACNLSLVGNGATGDPNTINNNDDIFDFADIFIDLECPNNVIFENGFEPLTPIQFIQSIPLSEGGHEKPFYDKLNNVFVFFDSEYRLKNDEGFTNYENIYQWLNEVLVINDPNGDWDADEIINELDLKPFNLKL